MQKYQDDVKDPAGNGISGALVTVKTYPAAVLATLYDDDGVTTIANPVTCDAYGRYSFRAVNGNYSLTFSGTRLVTYTKNDVLLFDPEDGTASANIGFTPAGTGAVATDVQTELNRQTWSVFRYMTEAEVAAVEAYSFSVNVTTKVQAAINAAWAAKRDLFAPAGGYLVTGLTLPGSYPTPDERDQAFRFYGQGYGNPFSTLNGGGTVFKSTTNAPVLTDAAIATANAHGTYEIDHIRFDGSSTTPVVLINGLYGTSSIHHCVVYQRSTGDGVKILYGATSHVHDNYSINSQFAVTGIGAARTGVGFNFPSGFDAGLVTYSKNTSRGFLTGYVLGGGAGAVYSAKLEDCEASTVYNGVILQDDTNSTTVVDCYFEGGDGGIGIQNLGSYNKIQDNLIFPGFLTLIEDTSTINVGTLIEGNVVSSGAVVNAIGVNVTSSAAFGGFSKNVNNNTFVYTAGTAGVTGLKINGTDPRITYTGNGFNPKAAWTGAGTVKINDTSSNGAYGLTQKTVGDYEFPFLSQGAIALFSGNPTITESSVTANNMTLPEGSYFVVTATGATSVNRFTAGVIPGRWVIFRTTNANLTFTDSAYNQTAGGVSFTGPGTITFYIGRVGADSYAYELSRTVF